MSWREPIRRCLVAAFALAVLAACGSEESVVGPTAGAQGSEAAGPRKIATERLYSVADLKAAGLKLGKTYDTDGLPGATGAALMFFRQKDIEIRLFPSHEVAVSDGIPIAREIVGSAAVIQAGSVTWDKAIGDQRACAPGNLGGGRDCTRQPKYGDFVTVGNLIILCEGRVAEDSAALCQEIVSLLPQ
ncbi:MAG: hypothetical protein FJ314_09520 [SAR202 cluster bacterium]|nr:hypothetical protein [SAR202 cluster bacterium]